MRYELLHSYLPPCHAHYPPCRATTGRIASLGAPLSSTHSVCDQHNQQLPSLALPCPTLPYYAHPYSPLLGPAHSPWDTQEQVIL